ncbi:chemokine XC receptor 1 [Chanos chanos]|uniref:Chemokine XC receptor 1 n=1 Tax=Chanos chanos TaxID=29144 RepID=A0A6J2VI51_CHACN|nr:chemokine XC receptor 1-like [Chanos chanos]
MSGDGDNETTTSNYYTYDYDDEICNKTDVIRFGAIVTPVFFSVVIVLSLLGNALVLVILVKYENLKSLTNTFLLNLAVSDLIFTSGLPFWASFHVYGWTFGDAVCKGVNFVFHTGFYSSIIFLTSMTIHRYMAVVHPMSVVISRRSCPCIVTSVIIWVVSFAAATPVLIFSTVKMNPNEPNVNYCGIADLNWQLWSTYQKNGFFIFAFVIMIFCYVQILMRLLRPTSHTKRRTVRLILSIVVVYFLGWAPYNVSIFLNSLMAWNVSPFNECHISITIDYIFYVCRLVAFSHCCLNPVFYVFVGIKFRNHLKVLLRMFCKSSADPQNRHSLLIYSNGEEFSMY